MAAAVLSAAAVLFGACETTPPEVHVETESAKLTGGPTAATFADLFWHRLRRHQIYFYNMYDAEANGGICTFDAIPEHFFGLIRYGDYPKASYTAIQRFVALLGGYHVTGSEVAAGARAWQKPYIVDVADASGHRGKIVWDAIAPSLNPQYTIAIPPGVDVRQRGRRRLHHPRPAARRQRGQ